MSYQDRRTALVALMTVLTFAVSAVADEPNAKPAVVAPDTDLETILQEWQERKDEIDRIDARLTYICYDHIFKVVYEGQGLVSADQAWRGFYKVEPRVAEAGTARDVVRHSPDGTPYKVRPASPECWYSSVTRLIKVDIKHREFEEVVLSPEDVQRLTRRLRQDRPAPPPLPENVRPNQVSPWLWFDWSLIQSQLAHPFLLGTSLEEMRSDFKITLTQQTHDEFRLKFVPKSRLYLESAALILDRNTYQPRALQLTYGNRTEVFILSDIRINQPPTPPFVELERPDLEGYRRLLGPDLK